MKKPTTPWAALLTFTLFLGSFPLRADTEIAIEEDEPAVKATPVAQQSSPAQTAPAQQQDEEESIEIEDDSEEKPAAKEQASEESAEEESAGEEVSVEEEEAPSTGSMRPVYEAGIKAYQQKSYWKAVSLLSKASEIKDPRTPKYYYAEAHAMMGVIFQFYLKNPAKACRHYQLALKIDPKTRTALKYRNRVCR